MILPSKRMLLGEYSSKQMNIRANHPLHPFPAITEVSSPLLFPTALWTLTDCLQLHPTSFPVLTTVLFTTLTVQVDWGLYPVFKNKISPWPCCSCFLQLHLPRLKHDPSVSLSSPPATDSQSPAIYLQLKHHSLHTKWTISDLVTVVHKWHKAAQ